MISLQIIHVRVQQVFEEISLQSLRSLAACQQGFVDFEEIFEGNLFRDVQACFTRTRCILINAILFAIELIYTHVVRLI